MTAWNERVLADVTASAPALPARKRILGHGVLLKDRPGEPDILTDARVKDFATAAGEAVSFNRSLTAGRAVVVEFREVPQ